MKTHTHLTRYSTGVYTYLPGRDIMADLAKAERKKYAKPSRKLNPIGDILNRFVSHFMDQCKSGNPPESVSVFHTHAIKSNEVIRANRDIAITARRYGVRVNPVDPADWGFPS